MKAAKTAEAKEGIHTHTHIYIYIYMYVCILCDNVLQYTIMHHDVLQHTYSFEFEVWGS